MLSRPRFEFLVWMWGFYWWSFNNKLWWVKISGQKCSKNVHVVYEWSLLAIFNLSSIVCKGVLLRGALPRVLMVGLPLLSNVPWGSRFKSIICKDQKSHRFGYGSVPKNSVLKNSVRDISVPTVQSESIQSKTIQSWYNSVPKNSVHDSSVLNRPRQFSPQIIQSQKIQSKYDQLLGSAIIMIS